MPSLANLMEDYRNWRGRSEWEQGKAIQDIYGGDPTGQERFERFGGFGTGSHGVGGLAGMIKAYHGSPHAFDKFDMSKIGSGEGAQAYGHGLYFAQEPEVAYKYLDAARNNETGLPAYVALLKEQKQRGMDVNPELFEAAIDKTKAPEKTSFYDVELKWPDAAREAADPLGEHHLLDWDAPLSEQPSLVREALSGLNLPAGTYGENPVGAHAYAEMAKRLDQGDQELLQSVKQHPNLFAESPELVSAWLKSKGIPGIRYLDQASRGAGTGSRNYVMFDDQFPNIVSRNGVSLSDLMKSETPQSKLDALIQSLESQGLNVDAFYNPKSNQVSLSRLVVPKESRGQGIGTKAMQDLIDFADEQNALMSLSPSTDFGATSINRLKDFYSRFGFVPNKGKYKDYSISESMYRPKK